MKLNRRETIGGLSALAAGVLVPGAVMACRLFPRDSVDRYTAYQAGAEVGAQSFEFSRSIGRFLVRSQLDLSYRTGDGKTLSFSHRAQEVWHRGWLNAFNATTRHGSRQIDVEAESVEHGILSVRSSETDITLQVSGYVVPTNLWHRDSRLVNRLIDLVHGRVRLVKVFYAGKDVLPSAGGATVATHYRVRGEFSRDAWYSERCQLIRIRMPIQDAAPVNFELAPAGA